MVVAAFLGLSALVGVVAGNQCFVCVPPSGVWREEGLKFFEDSLPCDHFNPNDKRFIRECPSQYPSCLIYKNASRMYRMCSNEKGINDCKQANDVEYCLCSGNLCNGNSKHPITSDDEDQDISEGSGSDSRDIIPSAPTTGSPPHGTTSVHAIQSCAPMIRTLLPTLIVITTSTIYVT